MDTLVLWLCSGFLFKGYAGEYILSPLVSFECANLVNYMVSVRFVWRYRMLGRKRIFYFRRYLAYNLLYSGVLLLKMALLLLVERLTGLDVIWCNLIALTISGLINFIMYDLVIF